MTIHFQKVIECFENMDTKTLEICLDPASEIMDVPSSVFIDKINRVFDNLKSMGDEKLIARKGSCNSGTCANKGESGISFLAPKSNKRLDFIFECENDTLNEIYHCNGFCLKNKNTNEDSQLIIVDFAEEEGISFSPDDFYIAYHLPCSKAMKEANELIDKNGNLTLDDCIYLTTKYAELLEAVQEENTGEKQFEFYEYFYNSFTNFSIIVNLQQLEADTLQAMNDFSLFANNDYEALRDWILNYKSLLDEVTEIIHLHLYRDFVISSIYDAGQHVKCLAEIKSAELIKKSSTYNFFVAIDTEMNNWQNNGGRYFEEQKWRRGYHNF